MAGRCSDGSLSFYCYCQLEYGAQQEQAEEECCGG